MNKSLNNKKKQNLISAIIIIAGIILAFLFLGPKDKQVEAEKKEIATKVEVLKVGDNKSKTASLTKTVIFESNISADAVAEQAGRIVNVNFKVGQLVQKGQILASFDQADSVNSAKVALEDSITNLELTRDIYKKTKKSAEESIEIARNNRKIAEVELEQAEDGGDQDEIDLAEEALGNYEDAEDKAKEDAKITTLSSELQVSQAEATVRQNQVSYEKTIIRAPITGIVTAKNIDRYDYITSGTGIAEISGTSNLNAKVYLSSFELALVDEGDSIKIIIDDNEYSGRISSLTSIANSSNNRFEVLIESADEISDYANRSAEIEITLKLNAEENVFFAPLSAVIIGQQNNTVFVYRDDVAKIVEVEIGKTIGNQVEIVNGLQIGDQLIVTNNRNLTEGEKVEIK